MLLLLSAAALIAFWSLDFAVVQPNRIAPGTGKTAIEALGGQAAGLYTVLLLLLLVCSIGRKRGQLWAALGLSTGALMALPFSLALFASYHISPDQPFARVGVGAALWVNLFLLSLIIIECQQRLRLPAIVRPVPLALVIVSAALCVATGGLDELALLREYQSRSSQFGTALRVHLQLVGGAVGASLVLGFALAVQMLRRPSWQKPVLAILSFFQTIPSLALFGLLIAPLAWASSQWPWLQQFGIRGIGWAPAMLALIGYSLLPMVRNTWLALRGVSISVLESARGMGMSPLQVFLQVRLPLAMPVMLEGIRITTVQAIGLTAVAALIGAGGFGTFIFQGLGQAANELILLGAIPTIMLALVADALFTALAAVFRRHHEEAHG